MHPRDRRRDSEGSLGKRPPLEHAHGPVPDHRAGRADEVAELLRRRRPDVKRHQPGGNLPDAHGVTARAVEALGDDGIHRERDPDAPPAAFRERPPRRLDEVRLDQRASDVVAERAQERERHRPADRERVDQGQELLNQRELVRYLGAAEDREERPLGVLEQPPELGQLAFHQQARGGRLEEARDRVDRRLRPMRRREGVVDIAVGEPRERPRKLGIVGLFLGMEAQVLEQHHLPEGERLRPRFRDRADAVRRERDRHRKQLPEPGRDRCQRVLRVRPPPGPAEVRGEDDRPASRQ